MATILTSEERDTFRRIAIKSAGRGGRFDYLASLLASFDVGTIADITDELSNDELSVVSRMVETFGDVPSKERAPMRSLHSAFQRAVRKFTHDETASIVGSYMVNDDEKPCYLVERIA